MPDLDQDQPLGADAATPAVPPPTPPPSDDGQSHTISDQLDGRDAAVTGMIAGVAHINPDAAAKMQDLAARAGVAPSTATLAPEEAQRRAAANEAAALRLSQDHPSLAAWLSDPEHAQVAHDDLPAAAAISATMQYLSQEAQHLAGDGSHDLTGLLPTGYRFLRDGTIVRPIGDGAQAEQFPDFAAALADAKQRGDGQLIDAMTRADAVQQMARQLGVGDRMLVAAAQSASFGLSPALTAAGAAIRAQQSGGENFLTQDLPGLVGGTAATVLTAGLGDLAGIGKAGQFLFSAARVERALQGLGAGARVLDYARAGAEMASAMAVPSALGAAGDYAQHGSAAHAGMDFLLNEGVVGLIPMGAMGRFIRGAPGTLVEQAGRGTLSWGTAAQDILSSVGWQGAQGAASVLGGALNDHATLGTPFDPYQTMADMAHQGLLGGIGGGAFGGLEAWQARDFRTLVAARAATDGAATLDTAVAQVRASKLYDRSQPAMASMLHSLNQGDIGDTLHVDAEGWRDAWMAAGMDPHAQAVAAGVGDAYAQALAAKGMFPVERGAYILAAAQEGAPASLRDHVALTADGMTAGEAQDHLDTRAAERQAIADRLAREADAATPHPEDARIQEQFARSIAAATPGVSAEQAHELAGRATAMLQGVAAGGKTTVQDLLERRGIIIRALHPVPEADDPGHYHGGDVATAESEDALTAAHRLGPERMADELAQSIAAADRTPVQRVENVPYGMGLNEDGTVAYRDPQFPEQATSIHGKPIDTVRATLMHELTERRWMDAGHSYQEAHAVANAVERAWLASQGHADAAISAYERDVQHSVRKTRDWTGPPPADLDMRPYQDEDEMSLLVHPDQRGDMAAREQAGAQLSAEAQRMIRAMPPGMRDAIAPAILARAQETDRAGDAAAIRAAHAAQDPTVVHPATDRGPRGRLTFGPQGRFLLELAQHAESSTVMHEFAHIAFEMLGDIAQSEHAAPWAKEAYQTLLDFSGYGTHEAKEAALTEATAIAQRAHAERRALTADELARVTELNAGHEKVAVGHERYLMEGRAPSEALRPVFAMIKAWMLNVYEHIKQLGMPLSDDVRAVFDRLHRGGDAVANAVAAEDGTFQNARDAGMTDAEFADYRKGIDEERTRAAEEVQSGLLAQYRAALAQARQQRQGALRRAVEANVYRDRDVAALRAIQRGVGPDGAERPPPAGATTWKLSKQELDARFPGARDNFPGYKTSRNRGAKLYAARDGMPLDAAAAAHGYATADEMVQALTRLPDVEGSIDHEVQRLYGMHHPEAMNEEMAMQAAHDALRTDRQARRLQQEAERLRALAADRAKKAADPQAIARRERNLVSQRALDRAVAEAGRAHAAEGVADAAAIQRVIDAAIEKDPAFIDRLLQDDDRTSSQLRRAADAAAAEAAKLAARRRDNRKGQNAAGVLRDSRILSAMAERRASADLTTARTAPREAARRATEDAAVMAAHLDLAARRVVDGKAVSQLNPSAHDRSAAKAAKAFQDAVVKGDYDGAYQAKLQQMLAGFSAKHAREALRHVYRAADIAKDLSRGDARAAVGIADAHAGWLVDIPGVGSRVIRDEAAARDLAAQSPGATITKRGGYLDAIDRILAQYQWGAATPRQLGRLRDLRGWVDGQARDGIPVSIPDSVLARTAATHWREAPVSEIRDAGDALRAIAATARMDGKLYRQQQGERLDAMAADLRATAEKNVRQRTHTPGAKDTLGEKALRWLTSHLRVHDMVQRLDGMEDGGVWHEAWEQPNAACRSHEQTMNHEDGQELRGILDRYAHKDRLYEREHIPGIGDMTRGAQIMVALNLGSEGNLDRLTAGNGYSKDQVRAIVERLDGHDRDFCNALWAFNEKRREQAFALEERVHGVRPDPVRAAPFTTHAGVWNGGYHPIMKDGDLAADRIREDADALLKGTGNGYAMTAHGHLKARTAGDGKPLDLDINRVAMQAMRVNKDIAWRERLIDAQRMLSHPDIGQTIVDRLGKDAYSAFKNQLDTAAGKHDYVSPEEQWLDGIRSSFMAMKRYANVAMAMRVPGQMLSIIPRVGLKWSMVGAMKSLSWEAIEAKSTVMRFRNGSRLADLGETARSLERSALRMANDKMAYAVADRVWKTLDSQAWSAFYFKSIAEGKTEDEAISVADAGMVETQGAVDPLDKARALSGNGLSRVFTNNMAFANAQLNEVAREVFRYLDGKRGLPNAGHATATILGYVAAAGLADAGWAALLRGKQHDGDDDGHGMVSWALTAAMRYALSMTPLTRLAIPVVNAAAAAAGVADPVPAFADRGGLDVAGPFGSAEQAVTRAIKAVHTGDGSAGSAVAAAALPVAEGAAAALHVPLPIPEAMRLWKGYLYDRDNDPPFYRAVTAPLMGPPQK